MAVRNLDSQKRKEKNILKSQVLWSYSPCESYTAWVSLENIVIDARNDATSKRKKIGKKRMKKETGQEITSGPRFFLRIINRFPSNLTVGEIETNCVRVFRGGKKM